MLSVVALRVVTLGVGALLQRNAGLSGIRQHEHGRQPITRTYKGASPPKGDVLENIADDVETAGLHTDQGVRLAFHECLRVIVEERQDLFLIATENASDGALFPRSPARVV